MVQLPPAAPRLNAIVLERKNKNKKKKKKAKEKKKKKIVERKSTLGIRLDIATTLKA